MNPTTTTPTPKARPEAAFVGHLHAMARAAEDGRSEHRAKLARLRRTLTGRALTFGGLHEVGDVLPSDLSNRQLDVYLLVAALFSMNPAAHPNAEAGSLGTSLRTYRRSLSAGAESLDRRVTALLDAHADDLPYRLRQVMQQLAAANVAPNYFRLLSDLLRWDHPNRRVQRQWAKDYWVG